tara:strand:+ start:568 stop:705 length:138 start_codon:yes stop_codon:yes gene_type:complete
VVKKPRGSANEPPDMPEALSRRTTTMVHNSDIPVLHHSTLRSQLQ